MERCGLDGDELGVRMTGCPNGCARPYSTEIALVGHRKDRYDIHLGGAGDGTRLNEVFADSVPAERIATVLEPVLAAYAAERRQGESFGDYVHRLGVDRLRTRFPVLVGAL